jgi:hypothetical protein
VTGIHSDLPVINLNVRELERQPADPVTRRPPAGPIIMLHNGLTGSASELVLRVEFGPSRSRWSHWHWHLAVTQPSPASGAAGQVRVETALRACQ